MLDKISLSGQGCIAKARGNSILSVWVLNFNSHILKKKSSSRLYFTVTTYANFSIWYLKTVFSRWEPQQKMATNYFWKLLPLPNFSIIDLHLKFCVCCFLSFFCKKFALKGFTIFVTCRYIITVRLWAISDKTILVRAMHLRKLFSSRDKTIIANLQ